MQQKKNYKKPIHWFGRSATIVCDGQCSKAWGINNRPKVQLTPHEDDDYAFLADAELGTAPKDPGTYECGCAKPDSPDNMNKWCARECERSKIVEEGNSIDLPDFSKRYYNIPRKTAPTLS